MNKLIKICYLGVLNFFLFVGQLSAQKLFEKPSEELRSDLEFFEGDRSEFRLRRIYAYSTGNYTLSHDGRFLVSCHTGSAKVFDTVSGKEFIVRVWEYYGLPIRCEFTERNFVIEILRLFPYPSIRHHFSPSTFEWEFRDESTSVDVTNRSFFRRQVMVLEVKTNKKPVYIEFGKISTWETTKDEEGDESWYKFDRRLGLIVFTKLRVPTPVESNKPILVDNFSLAFEIHVESVLKNDPNDFLVFGVGKEGPGVYRLDLNRDPLSSEPFQETRLKWQDPQDEVVVSDPYEALFNHRTPEPWRVFFRAPTFVTSENVFAMFLDGSYIRGVHLSSEQNRNLFELEFVRNVGNNLMRVSLLARGPSKVNWGQENLVGSRDTLENFPYGPHLELSKDGQTLFAVSRSTGRVYVWKKVQLESGKVKEKNNGLKK